MAEIIIIGAGAAGMMAAITAAECGHTVYVFEKMRNPGRKSISPEKEGVILPMIVTGIVFLLP